MIFKPVEVNDPAKFLLLALCLFGLFLLLGLERIPTEAGIGLLGLIIGYLTGNGRLASKGRGSEPTFSARREGDG